MKRIKTYLLNNGRGQKASKGMVIHFPMQVNEITKTLQVNFKQSDVIFMSENFNEEEHAFKCV